MQMRMEAFILCLNIKIQQKCNLLKYDKVFLNGVGWGEKQLFQKFGKMLMTYHAICNLDFRLDYSNYPVSSWQ